MVSVRRILEYKGKFLFNVALRLMIFCPVLFTRFFFVPRQCGPNKLNWAVHEVAINKKSRDRDQFVSSGQMSGILCSVEVNRKKDAAGQKDWKVLRPIISAMKKKKS